MNIILFTTKKSLKKLQFHRNLSLGRLKPFYRSEQFTHRFRIKIILRASSTTFFNRSLSRYTWFSNVINLSSQT